jgi:hypothetical protein
MRVAATAGRLHCGGVSSVGGGAYQAIAVGGAVVEDRPSGAAAAHELRVPRDSEVVAYGADGESGPRAVRMAAADH